MSQLRLIVCATVAAVAVSCASSEPVVEPDPSTTPLELRQQSVEEYNRGLVRCLADAGVEAVIIADGDGFEVRDTEVDPTEALQRCRSQARPPDSSDLPVSEIRAVYDKWLGARECLESFGHVVSDPPSFEVFLDQWETGPWNPYLDLKFTEPGEFERMNQECPQ